MNLFNSNTNETRPFVFKFKGGVKTSSIDIADLFFENPCVNRALNLIANSISKLDLITLRNGKIEEKSLVYDILKKPSTGSYTSDFIESLVFNYLIYGNAFILLQEDKTLSNLITPCVSLVIDKKNSNVSHYLIKKNEGEVMQIAADSLFPLVGHFKNHNPLNSLYGYSVMESIKTSANLYQCIDKHNLSLIQNSGRPSGIVSINSSHTLSDEEYKEFRDNFYEQYSGSDKTGNVMFLSNDVTWQPLTDNNNDMDYGEASKRALRAIATGLGVPASLIGDLSVGENSKSNIESMFEIFNSTTIEPMAKKISQFLTMFFSQIDSEIEIKLINNKEQYKELIEIQNIESK